MTFVYLSSNCISQTVTFQKTYGGSIGDMCNSIKQTSDGGYIMAGSATITGFGSPDILVARFDANGDSLWFRKYGGVNDESGACIEQLPDGDFIVAGIANGSYIYLLKLDMNGDTLWTKSYAGGKASSISLTDDGGFVVAGGTGTNAFLLKTDSLGNSQWIKEYGGTSKDEFIALKPTLDGGYILAGFTGSYGAGQSDGYLVKTDSSGNMLWSKTYGGSSVDFFQGAIETSDRGFLITGSTSNFGAGLNQFVYVIRTDSIGDTLWTKTYSYHVSHSIKVIQTVDGGFLIVGDGGNNIVNAFLLKIDLNGNVQWSNMYGGNTGTYGYAIDLTSDGGFIMGGTSANSANYADVYLVKTDSLGISGCKETAATVVTGNTSTIIYNSPTITISSPIALTSYIVTTSNPTYSMNVLCSTAEVVNYNNNDFSFSVFPNPSNGNFTINTNLVSFEAANIQFYNLIGELIHTSSFRTGHASDFNLGQLDEGIYIASINIEQKIYFSKIIIHK